MLSNYPQLLLDDELDIKIVDFGLGNIGKDLLKTACGSPCYAAPEMIAGKKYLGTASDLWSLGVILFALLCGYLPFEDTNTARLYDKIMRGEYELPDFLSPSGKDLIRCLLNTDPKSRYTASQIRQHPWYVRVSTKTDPTNFALRRPCSTYINSDVMRILEETGYNPKIVTESIHNHKHDHFAATYHFLLNKHMALLKKTGQSLDSLVRSSDTKKPLAPSEAYEVKRSEIDISQRGFHHPETAIPPALSLAGANTGKVIFSNGRRKFVESKLPLKSTHHQSRQHNRSSAFLAACAIHGNDSTYESTNGLKHDLTECSTHLNSNNASINVSSCQVAIPANHATRVEIFHRPSEHNHSPYRMAGVISGQKALLSNSKSLFRGYPLTFDTHVSVESSSSKCRPLHVQQRACHRVLQKSANSTHRLSLRPRPPPTKAMDFAHDIHQQTAAFRSTPVPRLNLETVDTDASKSSSRSRYSQPSISSNQMHLTKSLPRKPSVPRQRCRSVRFKTGIANGDAGILSLNHNERFPNGHQFPYNTARKQHNTAMIHSMVFVRPWNEIAKRLQHVLAEHCFVIQSRPGTSGASTPQRTIRRPPFGSATQRPALWHTPRANSTSVMTIWHCRRADLSMSVSIVQALVAVPLTARASIIQFQHTSSSSSTGFKDACSEILAGLEMCK